MSICKSLSFCNSILCNRCRKHHCGIFSSIYFVKKNMHCFPAIGIIIVICHIVP